MFKTCIFCNRDLGDNDVVESFPIGRRLAFDADRGRLWVICERCRRWNLSPLEERWEAIEECERWYRDTPRRFSTDNIGMAELGEGLHLVRIGRPRRREFAAWRYGREFWRRRVRSAVATGVGAAIAIAGAVAGAQVMPVFLAIRARRVVARLRDAEGRRLFVSGKDAEKVRIVGDGSQHDWHLTVPYHPREKFLLLWPQVRGRGDTSDLRGPEALEAASRILPRINQWGGNDAQVKAAVELVEEAGGPERLFARAAEERRIVRRFGYDVERPSYLKKMPADRRLALEMSVHEESERRALEGELALLEDAWREAEEIAAIADRLLVPERVEEWIRRQKKKLARGG